MARKLNTRQAETSRAAIKTTLLIGRVQDHALGKIELSPSQLQAAQFLISMVLPKPVQQIEQTGALTISWAK